VIKKEATIIDGKKISHSILEGLKAKIDRDKLLNITPAKLAIILVGNDSASRVYVGNKMKAAEKVGIMTELLQFDSDLSESTLLEKIKLLNNDPTISGIIIQLPLPNHINKSKIIVAVDPNKDVDGFHPLNVGLLFSQYENGFVPCTAKGCLTLIKSCVPVLVGKNVAVVGRSGIVGRPLSALLLKEDCTVTMCHSKTKDLAHITSKADIVVSAIGIPKLLTKEYFNPDSVVIDVGINRKTVGDKSKLVGDVDFDTVYNYVKYITPVPGGVGPMTVACLLENTYNASLMSKTYEIESE
jgi:methylenetetrahydrofolate dehydrogenase (NADP+)/methenyltetrahydrofolate cyclohydrolase